MQPTLSDKPTIVVTIIARFKHAGLITCALVLFAACAAAPDTQRDDDPLPPEAIDGEEVDPEVLLHILAAERLGVADQGEQALDHYLKAAQLSDDPALAEEVTQLAVSIGAWDVAAAGAARWLELDPGAASARIFLVRAWLALEDIDAATAELGTMIEREEDATLAWQQAAALLGYVEDQALALAIMDDLIAATASADRPEALWAQSVLAWRMDDVARAIDLGEVAATRSGEVDQLLWIAQLAASEQEYERALALYRQAHEQAPEDTEIELAIVEILRLLERDDEAYALLQAMPPDAGVLFTYGLYLLEDEREAEALEVWRRMTGLEEDDRATHAFFTAQLARLLARDDDALIWYARVDEGPMRTRAILQQAVLLGEMDTVPEARRLLQGLRQEQDRDSMEQAWLVEAQILQDAGDQAQALEVLNASLAALPHSVPLLYSRALVAVALDDIDLAEQDFRRILQIEPDSALALNALGYTLTDRTNRHQEAYRLISRALEQEPDDPAILDSMGWVYFNLGRPQQALGYLRRALAGEYNPEIAAHLGEVLWELGERDEALAVLDEAYERYPEDEYLLDTRGRLGL